MNLFISVEGQNCTEIGLDRVLFEIRNKLLFLSAPNSNIERYGHTFESIAIIPTCVSDSVWNALGWKERVLLRYKTREADVRLRINYERFIQSNDFEKREMFVDTIIKSIRMIEEKSKKKFDGDILIDDIIKATGG